ncbi:hypothetical protein GUITHDRAFT_120085 [Guillardia theta CCMP2712]|uniref:Major facilitator superfamily (MFS) profile domain-containing protein n=1 Tax=Guillardia theta (strain CCMP2712) TaxID=905079 RepID=L1ICY0_GUITC|nr:hypothetical protein GUITHDRAFT_120085 [Guillardia theta CCMP2712]EKX33695.1 hypothetical protein GUITHDRAFT_120085 [Guillardia theta CCMP2712]|eukprot:XP_005820675.1 hypothetical protein GUITHDRAFT_120085 [Guillardia theta CCMP2712]
MAVGMHETDQISSSQKARDGFNVKANEHACPNNARQSEEESPKVEWGKEESVEDEKFWVNNSLTYLQDETDSDSKKIEVEETNYDNFQIPWFKVSCIFLAVASDAVALIGPVPFLPALCQDRFQLSEAEVGVVVGVLTGAYSLANFATSMVLGHWSDLCGRRFFILLGLFTSTVLTFALGFIHDPWTAILSRMMIGALNTNFALSRAAISDLIPPGKRAIPFAYLGATFALARTFSSAVGGFMVGLFFQDPFIAPCIALSLPPGITFVMVLFGLPEMHGKRTYDGVGDALQVWWRNRRSKARAEATVPYEEHKDEHANGTSTVKDEEGGGEKKAEEQKINHAHLTLMQKWKILTEDKLIMRLTIAFGVVSFANGFSFPESHGMGMNALQTGFAFTSMGLVGFFFQIIFYKVLLKTIGLRQIFKVCQEKK